MSIDINRECVRSKYFTSQADMDESLSDFQETKKSCTGPKPTQKSKPKTRKVTKRIKGQKDIRTALKGKKNELVSYSKEFDTVCKKAGVDVDSEQLQLAIALSKSLQTETEEPESRTTLSSQQRVAKIRKTLQEYGFKVPEAKITGTKKTKRHRKHYKLLTVTEEEKQQIITGKFAQILFENLDCTKVDNNSFNDKYIDARVFCIGSNISFECMRDNNIFYADNLVEKSTTNGSLLRDWSEIPGRPVSPKVIDTDIMDFKDIDCSQDELDVILSGSIKSVKQILDSKKGEYKKKYEKCNVPKVMIEENEEIMGSKDVESKINHDVISIDDNGYEHGVKTPVKNMYDMKSPVKRLFKDSSQASEEIDIIIISPVKNVGADKPDIKVTDVGISNKLTFTQQCRSCSPDIFDDELSSIMETTKPINVLSQEHKTKVFSQDNFMDLTQCANITSQNSEKHIQLPQNITKRRSNDFMEITECIIGCSQPIREELKEIDLTQSPEDKGAIMEGDSINVDNNIKNVSMNLSNNAANSVSQNITDEQQITVLSNHLGNRDSIPISKENIDLTQSSNEDCKGTGIMDLDKKTPDKNEVVSMDLTQSSNSDIDGLPLVDVANSRTQLSLDDTIIVDKEEYIENGKVKISIIFRSGTLNEVFVLTQAKDDSIQYNSSPVITGNTEEFSHSFYEDFVHDHSESTENSKEIAKDTDISKEHNSSQNESKESNDIDLTQDSDTSEERSISERLSTELQNIPNNSSLGKKDDVSIDYDEILIEDNICQNKSINESENYTQKLQYNSSKSDGHNDGEIVDEKDDFYINSSQNSEVLDDSNKKINKSQHVQYDSSKSEVHNDIKIVDDDNELNLSQNSEVFNISNKEIDKTQNVFEIVDEINNDHDLNSSQNSGVFHISDKELDYSLYKSRHEYRDNFDFGGISVLDNITGVRSFKKSFSDGYQSKIVENKNDTVGDNFLPEVNIKRTENKIKETEFEIRKAEGITPIKVQQDLNSNSGLINIKTPNNSEYIIKTDNVTPMADFASMSTPQRNRELDRYGLKPFKRKRAIQILTHIYNQTHPTIQQLEDENQPSPSKRLKTNTYGQDSSPKKLIISPINSPSKEMGQHAYIHSLSPLKKQKHERKEMALSKTDELDKGRYTSSGQSSKMSHELERDRHISSATPSNEFERDIHSSSRPHQKDTDMCEYEVTSEIPVVSNVDCSPEDWVFQKREKAKVHSCRVPLHVAFHNYVLSRLSLREAILKYEPVNIDVIHRDLVSYGHRYDPKDLLKFLDKKCITVKTTDNNARNNKR